MKVNRLETHDRYHEFVRKSESMQIQACCEDLLKKRPFGDHPFYLWVHARTAEDGLTKELIWQPRLTRPKPQTNSMLFKGYPLTMEIRVCWLIPPRELFEQYKKGNICEHDVSQWSIEMFENKREELAQPEPDDLSEAEIDAIYRSLSQEARYKKAISSSGIVLGH